MSSPVFSTRVLARLDDLRDIVPEWRELWQRCPRSTVFQSSEWILPWIEVFAPSDIRAIEIRFNSRLVGVAPLLIYPRSTEQVLAFMGGGVSDYLDVLLDPLFESEILEQLWRAIASLPGWTELDLTDAPASSPLRTARSRAEIWAQHDICSALALPSTESDLLRMFSNRQRSNLRNARSRLRSAGGGRIQIATQSDFSEFLDDLFRLHTQRWSASGQTGVLNDDSVRRFHKCAAPQLLDRGLLRLHRMCLGDRALAVIQSFWDHGTVFCYLQGFDPEFSYLSPGTLLMCAILEEAVRTGMQKFDFLRGEECYKQHWRAQPEFTYRLKMPRAVFMSVEQPSAA